MSKRAQLRILVVDDDELACRVVESRLREWGFRADYATDSGQAKKYAELKRPDIIISDVVMPGLSGIDLLKEVDLDAAQTAVILVTGHATVDMAVEAMKEGARDFLTKPIDFDHLKSTIQAVVQELELERETEAISSRIATSTERNSFVGESSSMRQVFEMIDRLAPTDASVLVTGESGTGKELVARALHENGGRAQEAFVAINAAAIPSELMESELFGHEKGAFTGAASQRAGCFELADRGTLLLDEIGEMPMALQPKLLRVLEDGQVRRLGGKKELTVDVRVVAATNREPKKAIEDGSLREDLYYRLNVFQIELPPLRDRGDDLLLLAQHFVDRFNTKHSTDVKGFRDSALEKMRGYRWPGNVRELRNIVERGVVLAGSGWIELSHLPPYVQGNYASGTLVLPDGITAAEAEKQLILKTFEETDGNKSETARRLDLDVKTIRYKLKSYGVK